MDADLKEKVHKELQKQVDEAAFIIVKEFPKFRNDYGREIDTPPREAAGRVSLHGKQDLDWASYIIEIGENHRDCNGLYSPFQWGCKRHHVGYLEIDDGNIKLEFMEPDCRPWHIPKVVESYTIRTHYIKLDMESAFRKALADERLAIGVLARKLSM